MMHCTCDNCGKTAPARHNGREWFHPEGWYSRIPNGERIEQNCCSRDCIAVLSAKTGKTAVVAPF